jgi:hypothetical protein
MMYDNRLDPINTTLVNPPGARSAAYKYTTYQELPSEMWEKQEPSVACQIATTAGDRQVDWCKPGKPNCPMSRNLEPTQRVDTDISYCDRDGDVFGNNYKIINKGPYSTEVVVPCKKSGNPTSTSRRRNETDMFLKIVLIIAVIIALLTLASKV